MFLQDGEQVVQQFRRNAEFCLLAGRDDLGVMARTDAGVEAHHDLAAGVDAAQGLHLGKGIHADQHTVLDGIAQLGLRDVVGDVKDLVGGEARQPVHVQLAGAHGIHHQAFFTDNAQQHGVGVGLDRIVDTEAGQGGKGLEFAAALAQHGLVVDIERRTELLGQIQRRMAFIKIDTVGIAGADLGHRGFLGLKGCRLWPAQALFGRSIYAVASPGCQDGRPAARAISWRPGPCRRGWQARPH